MTHVHHPDVEVVENSGGPVSAMLLAIVALLIVAMIAFAVVWSHPWGGGTTNTRPGISDNSGNGNGGQSGGGQTDGGQAGNGGSNGGQPAQ